MRADTQLSGRARGYIIANIIMMGLSFIMVAARLSCRVWLGKRKIWWDDFAVLVSLVLLIALGAVVNIATGNYGWDQHIWNVPQDEVSDSIELYITAKTLFFATSTCLRTAMLLFYLWLVRDYGNLQMKRVVWGCLIANGVLGIVAVLMTVFRCVPMSASLLPAQLTLSVCMDDGILTMSLGALCTLADLIVSILPLPFVARLSIPLRGRLQVSVLLSMGAVATIAGIFREICIYKMFFSATYDPTFTSLPMWICAELEIYLGLFCTCFPTIKPLWEKIIDKIGFKLPRFNFRQRDLEPPISSTAQCKQSHIPNESSSSGSVPPEWTTDETHSSILPPPPLFSMVFPKTARTTESYFV